MADRFFPNDFPDFVAESEASDGDGEGHRPAGLRGLLSLPYTRLSDRFVRAARRLKDKVRPARPLLSLSLVSSVAARPPGARLIALGYPLCR
jgi:hypothetical protein